MKSQMQDVVQARREAGALPDVMRLRVRAADDSENTTTKFRLGFKLPVLGIEIELNNVDKAGAESVFDLLTYIPGDQPSVYDWRGNAAFWDQVTEKMRGDAGEATRVGVASIFETKMEIFKRAAITAGQIRGGQAREVEGLTIPPAAMLLHQ